MANLKPILEELKSLKESINSDSIRELVLNNLQENRGKIEEKIKNLADTTKNNPVVNEYLDQILKAELTNQAVEKLQTNFPEHELVSKIVELRKSFIEPEEIKEEVSEPDVEKEDIKTEASVEAQPEVENKTEEIAETPEEKVKTET